jgi:hypothetical protein
VFGRSARRAASPAGAGTTTPPGGNGRSHEPAAGPLRVGARAALLVAALALPAPLPIAGLVLLAAGAVLAGAGALRVRSAACWQAGERYTRLRPGSSGPLSRCVCRLSWGDGVGPAGLEPATGGL